MKAHANAWEVYDPTHIWDKDGELRTELRIFATRHHISPAECLELATRLLLDMPLNAKQLQVLETSETANFGYFSSRWTESPHGATDGV